MIGGFVLRAIACFVLAIAGLSALAAPAHASDKIGRIAPSCIVDGTLDEGVAAALGRGSPADCPPDSAQDIAAERIHVLFDFAPGQPRPTHLLSRRSAVEAIHLTPVSARGLLETERHSINDQRTAGIEGFVSLALPKMADDATGIVVSFDRPTNVQQVTGAKLVTGDPQLSRDTQRGRIIAAIICGMLLMPMVFNFAFWRILRQRFLIWHSIAAFTMVLSILFTSGLALWLFGISMNALSFGSTLFFGLMVAAATHFAYHFIEPGKLDPRLRAALPWAAGLAALLSTLHACFPFVWRPVQLQLYMLAYVPVLAVQIAVVTDAIRRGSRAARYQAIGWGPLLLCGLIRQVTYLTPGLSSSDAMAIFYFGCAFEVFATAMGVADRLMHIKRQRDIARSAVRELEHLTERDALTGLLNRRVVERRFAELRKDGFATMAVIDLDHFKSVNDSFGHAVGDEVLKAVADALQADEDTLAVRMGGEEFLLFMRGEGAAARAEMRRRAITTHAARAVIIDRPITASMGLVEVPADGEGPLLGFDALYERADRLLYEAKAQGRNRTSSEKMQLFGDRRRADRRAAA